ncbi:Cof-type HAD-IIB family hydrolase [Geobacillus sp. C56-T3]|uniref:Cof-type HAD-IIB family hydrolase n=1 Tax=Geobacillus sp. (strain C56-T3) TaxID=691437 RepID=UPI0001D58871|nr:Cof-type HAD-IIB family hydrolase [Geobacillus sp. C56-T3]ADI27744.1 Cof-like hydrolase [Geobacillus sp. C56-T3]
MKPYLIALDLDGTLLKEDKTISPFTKDVIRRTIDTGHFVVIATGRPYRASSMYYEELGLATPIVNFNGAFVHHPRQPSWGMHHYPLPLAVVKDIVEISESYGIKNMMAEVLDNVYFHQHDEVLLDIVRLGNPTVEIGDLRRSLGKDPTSVLVYTDDDHIERIQSHLANVYANVIHQRRWSEPWHVIEIIRHGVHKAAGLKQVADYFGIPRERVIAFGDEDNDLEMIDWAGLGVAMGNAIEPLKTIADDVAKTNEEDGVGVYLQDLLRL